MKIKMCILLSLLSLNTFAGQDRGGGDVNSSEIRGIKNMFSNSGEAMRLELIKVFENVKKFTSQGKTSSQISDLIARGILEDFKHAPYVLRTACFDENGIERSASTSKVDLSNQSTPVRPEICINVRKLALEKANRANIIGLLAHEHSRHFGEEDTDELGLHPLAEFVTVKHEYLTDSVLSSGQPLGGIVMSKNLKSKRVILFRDVNYSGGIKLVIDDLGNNCRGFRAILGERIRMKLSVGSHLEINNKEFEYEDKFGFTLVKFYLDPNLLESSPIGAVGAVNRNCKFSYHFELNGQSSDSISASVVSNRWRSSFDEPNRFEKLQEYISVGTKTVDWLKDIE